jgi:hypothetical protein
MQTQIAHHLQAQEKSIELINEDAIQATRHVESANFYLTNAKRLFAESRLWIIVFFLTASFVLLFLDWWYS